MILSVSMSTPGTWTAVPAMRVIFSSAMGIGAGPSVCAHPEHLAGVGHRPGDGRGRDHEGAHQDRATGGAALAPLEVSVGRARAELVADELVRVHGQAHRAPGIAPLETRVAEDLVDPELGAQEADALGA